MLPFLFCMLISCGDNEDFIKEIHSLNEDDTITVYDTIDSARTDSIGNEISDTIISEKPDTITVYETVDSTRTDSIGNEISDTIISEKLDIVNNDLKITIDSLVFQFVVLGPGSMQGADCYDRYLFQFCDGFHYASCYDMSNGKEQAIFKFPGAPKGYNYHCNNADFSNTFYYEDDEYPLIYISQNAHKHVVVCRISRTNNTFSLNVIQTIVFKDLYSLDITIDNENGYMYNYAAVGGNKLRLLKYKIPDHRLSEEVTLTKEDILDTLDIDGYISDYQGARIKDGLFYFAEGVPNWGSDPCIRIVNLSNGSYSRFNLKTLFGFNHELEDLFFYNDELYCATNYGKGIFKVCLSFDR